MNVIGGRGRAAVWIAQQRKQSVNNQPPLNPSDGGQRQHNITNIFPLRQTKWEWYPQYYILQLSFYLEWQTQRNRNHVQQIIHSMYYSMHLLLMIYRWYMPTQNMYPTTVRQIQSASAASLYIPIHFELLRSKLQSFSNLLWFATDVKASYSIVHIMIHTRCIDGDNDDDNSNNNKTSACIRSIHQWFGDDDDDDEWWRRWTSSGVGQVLFGSEWER